MALSIRMNLWQTYRLLHYCKYPTGRQASLAGNVTDLLYFNVPTGGTHLSYTLTATNADGETMTSEARPILQESGAELTSGNYKVRIGLVQ